MAMLNNQMVNHRVGYSTVANIFMREPVEWLGDLSLEPGKVMKTIDKPWILYQGEVSCPWINRGIYG